MGVPFTLFASLKGLRGGLCRASLTLRCFAYASHQAFWACPLDP
ncbi:MAG: hypothetical protein NZ551_08250 [Microscillaceae bacterium]|nr:hypothetical protein [Microscillaceae bacterium]MDW8461189.1 hypothetical protein [Cytophagales bacterium]